MEQNNFCQKSRCGPFRCPWLNISVLAVVRVHVHMCICSTWLKHHAYNVCIACVVNMDACRGTRGTWQVLILYNLRYEVHMVCTRWHFPYPEHFPFPNTYPWATAQRWSDNWCSTVPFSACSIISFVSVHMIRHMWHVSAMLLGISSESFDSSSSSTICNVQSDMALLDLLHMKQPA